MQSIPFQPIIHKQVYIAASGVHTDGVVDDRVTFGRHFIVDHYVFTVVTAVITCHSFDLYILEPRPSLTWINFALSVSASALYFNCRKTSVNCKPTIVPYDPRHSVSRRASKMVFLPHDVYVQCYCLMFIGTPTVTRWQCVKMAKHAVSQSQTPA